MTTTPTATKKASQIEVGDVIVIHSRLANFIGRPELIGSSAPVTAVHHYPEGRWPADRVVGIVTDLTGERYARSDANIPVR